MRIVDLIPDLRAVILAARQRLDETTTLSPFLPNVAVPEITYRAGRQQRLDQVAPVRAFDAPSTPIRRPGVVDLRGDLPAITPREDITETDLNIAQRMAQVSIDLTPSVTQAAGRVARTVSNTLEQMRGQVLSTGAVSLQLASGQVQVVDFGIPSGQKFTPPKAWTDPTNTDDPFDQLEAWHAAYVAASGADAGIAVTTRRVTTLLAVSLRKKYPQQPIGVATIQGELALRGLPPMTTDDRTLTDETGTRRRIFPEGALTFLPAAGDPVGNTQLGPTQEALQQVGGTTNVLRSEEVPGLTLVTLGNDDPVQRAVKGAAVGMPVLRDVDAIVCVNGITG